MTLIKNFYSLNFNFQLNKFQFIKIKYWLKQSQRHVRFIKLRFYEEIKIFLGFFISDSIFILDKLLFLLKNKKIIYC